MKRMLFVSAKSVKCFRIYNNECKKIIAALLTLKSKNGERLYMRAFEQVLKDITGKSSSEEVTAKEQNSLIA